MDPAYFSLPDPGSGAAEQLSFTTSSRCLQFNERQSPSWENPIYPLHMPPSSPSSGSSLEADLLPFSTLSSNLDLVSNWSPGTGSNDASPLLPPPPPVSCNFAIPPATGCARAPTVLSQATSGDEAESGILVKLPATRSGRGPAMHTMGAKPGALLSMRANSLPHHALVDSDPGGPPVVIRGYGGPMPIAPPSMSGSVGPGPGPGGPSRGHVGGWRLNAPPPPPLQMGMPGHSVASGYTSTLPGPSGPMPSGTLFRLGQGLDPKVAAAVRAKIQTVVWEDESSLVFQVEVNQVTVTRERGTDLVNGTKLLNAALISRGKRDGILKNEKYRRVVKQGTMALKGVWIGLDRARALATKYEILSELFPLLEDNLAEYLAATAPAAGAYPQSMLPGQPLPGPRVVGPLTSLHRGYGDSGPVSSDYSWHPQHHNSYPAPAPISAQSPMQHPRPGSTESGPMFSYSHPSQIITPSGGQPPQGVAQQSRSPAPTGPPRPVTQPSGSALAVPSSFPQPPNTAPGSLHFSPPRRSMPLRTEPGGRYETYPGLGLESPRASQPPAPQSYASTPSGPASTQLWPSPTYGQLMSSAPSTGGASTILNTNPMGTTTWAPSTPTANYSAPAVPSSVSYASDATALYGETYGSIQDPRPPSTSPDWSVHLVDTSALPANLGARAGQKRNLDEYEERGASAAQEPLKRQRPNPSPSSSAASYTLHQGFPPPNYDGWMQEPAKPFSGRPTPPPPPPPQA